MNKYLKYSFYVAAALVAAGSVLSGIRDGEWLAAGLYLILTAGLSFVVYKN